MEIGETLFSTTDGGGERFTHLHQAYAASLPRYTGKVTVPVLWDRRTRQIVSNDSLDILIMQLRLSSAQARPRLQHVRISIAMPQRKLHRPVHSRSLSRRKHRS